MPKVGVLLSGCGFLDGAEIHESVLTLLALDQRQAQIICCAPNIAQAAVVDHQTRQPTGETRNVLKEAARIARCEIQDVAQVKADELDALIIPGGFGAMINLSTLGTEGPEDRVDPGVEKLVGDMLALKKPIGAICIAPALLAHIAGRRRIKAKVTIGNDSSVARKIAEKGCIHEDCTVDEISVDETNKLVTTPAYMLGSGPAAIWEGIRKLVDRVLRMI
mgnify:CR=1 FL=1